MNTALEIKNLHVSVEDQPILKGIDLLVKQGEVHALMGPNGSGKSTLAYSLAGHPAYETTAGEVIFDGIDLLDLAPDERSRAGLFLAFQYPVAVPGVTVANFLRQAINARRRSADSDDKGIPIPAFRVLLKEKMDMLSVDHRFAGRYLNDGFSGGEKKRAAIAAVLACRPEVLALDEPWANLDARGARAVTEIIRGLSTTRIIASQDLYHASEVCERMVILEEGRVVADGPMDKLLAEKDPKKRFEMQPK